MLPCNRIPVHKYIFSRLLQAVPVIFGVALISFILSELSGSPVRAALGQHADPETIKKIEAFYGYDKPSPVRFVSYLGHLANGNLGVSISKEGVPVSTLIVSGMSVTLKIALGAMLVAIALGVTAGVVSASRPNSALDYTALIGASLGVSFPAFFLGMLFLLLFAVRLHWFPIGGYVPGSLRHLVLPCLSLGLISTASIARLTRNCMLETLSQDYVRSGRAKGLGNWYVLVGHALPNALVPVVTIIGSDFGGLLVGAVLTETVYQVPGVGSVINDAIFERDLPVIMGCCIIFALIFIGMNLLVDVSYAFLDPRIRHAQ